MKPTPLVVAALSLTACGGGAKSLHTREAGAVSALAVKPVTWNQTGAAIGKVKAVTDAGDVVAVMADDGAHVFMSGVPIATDKSVTDWVDADTILGPDGTGRWIIAINGGGRVYHLRGRSSFEEVSERYALAGNKVRGAAVLGRGFVGFLLDGEVALADGSQVARFGLPARASLAEIVGGGGFGAGLAGDRVLVFGAAEREVRQYQLPGATAVALGHDGRLYATTPRAVYASANAIGELDLVYEASGDSIHGLVASGEHVWFADGTELGVIDGNRVRETKGTAIASNARLAASSTGDVWVLANGELSRFARVDPEPDLDRAWQDKLSGVFARACASCHMPDGPSGIDLSTAESWQTRRAQIRNRVLVSHTMPPQGKPLSDVDRSAIDSWASAAATAPPPPAAVTPAR